MQRGLCKQSAKALETKMKSMPLVMMEELTAAVLVVFTGERQK